MILSIYWGGVTSVIPAVRRRRKKDQKIKVSLGYIVNLGLAWAMRDPKSKRQTNKSKTNTNKATTLPALKNKTTKKSGRRKSKR